MIKKITLILILFYTSSCAQYPNNITKKTTEKKFFSSSGFALIYSSNLFENKEIDKRFKSNKILDNKLNNEEILVMHSWLKKNTPINITNPDNSKTISTKIFKRANYPKIFNIVISKKLATILDLDLDNPYLEINEIKKNKTFIAKKTITFEEERTVADTASVGVIEVDDLSSTGLSTTTEPKKKNNFILVVSDFYYFDSAENLKNELIKKTQINGFTVKKINDKKYRLSLGPFENFNTLKSAYISLNNLGFEDLNIYNKIK
tara:strand:+ start:2515 stop:3300 length:786 start_codon:yes stop_codon:yes gene_type:complete